MSAIFLSHSSKDTDRAAALQTWLETQGHTVFLDSDPGSGIAGGVPWEKVLYERLHVCQAVIPLLSPNWIASRWCFAELVHARATGKTVVPVCIAGYGPERVFADLQEIDLTTDVADGYRRLRRALQTVFPWDPARPPYPGLAAYVESDAAVFLGRAEETTAGLEVLESLRRRGGSAPRLLVVLGASGSGKSSLVRAGWIPRLNDREWLVVPPFRPRGAPINELAISIAAAFSAAGQPRDWSEIAASLARDAATASETTSTLLDAARDLQVRAGHRDATVLVVLDQAEELFSAADTDQGMACVALLRAALDRADAEFMVVATLRSDFLGIFQQHRFLAEGPGSQPLAYERFAVGPMPASRIPDVIRGPAQRVGFQVDDALVAQLTADIQTVALGEQERTPPAAGTQTADALPLLAFTLRRLWDTEKYRSDGRLDLADYADLGGLAGAVSKVAAETLNAAAMTPGQLAALKAAFIPCMIHASATGAFTRRRALLSEIPSAAVVAVQKLVEARLLIADRDQAGERTIEVAHEALFRMWPLLARWLDEDRDKLRLLAGVQMAARDWEAASRREDLLVHRGARLADALALYDAADRRFAADLDRTAADYLGACRREQTRREAEVLAEQERRLRDARTIVRRTAIGLAIAGVFLAVASVALVLMFKSRAAALDQSRLILATHLREEDPTRAGLVLLELAHPLSLFNLRGAALDVLSSRLAFAELRHDAAVLSADIDPDGKTIVTGSADRTARVWHIDAAAAPVSLAHRADVYRVRFSLDGRRIATVSLDNFARVWSLDGRSLTPDLPHDTAVSDFAFNSAGDRLVTTTFGGSVLVWAVAQAGSPQVLNEPSGVEGRSVAFDRSGRRVLAAFGDGKVRMWQLDGDAADARTCDHGTPLVASAFSRDEASVLSVGNNGSVSSWTPGPNDGGRACAPVRVIDGAAADVERAVFSRERKYVAIVRRNRTVTIYDTSFEGKPVDLRVAGVSRQAFMGERHYVAGDDGGRTAVYPIDAPTKPVLLLGHDGSIQSAVTSANGDMVVTTSDDGTARVWKIGEPDPAERVSLVLKHERSVSAIDVSRDGARILTASLNGEAHLWTPDGQRIRKFVHSSAVRWAAFNPKGDMLLTVPNGGDVRVYGVDQPGTAPLLVLHDSQEPDTPVFAAFAPDGDRIVSTSVESGIVRVWNLKAGGAPTRLRGHQPGGTDLRAVFSPAGDVVVTTSTKDGTARVWRIDSDPPTVTVLPHGSGVAVASASFSPDGRSIVTAAADGIARVWQVGRRDPAATLAHGKPVRVAVFSHDGRRVLTGTDDGVARIWTLGRENAPLVLAGHRKAIVSAEFSPDDRLVLTASADQTARLWNADGSGDSRVFGEHVRELVRAMFTPSGDKIVTGSADGHAVIWTIAPDRLLQMIRSRTRLCLQPEFRMRYLLEDTGTAQATWKQCELTHQANVDRE